MLRLIIFAAASGLCLAGTAHAEVKSASPSGFEVENKALIPAAPAQVYTALGAIERWWASSHTYSGDAKNLRLELKAGGCFCESLKDGGSVEHMRVVYAEPGKMLRLSGGLGPLQSQAVAATLTFTLREVPGGTEITQNYIVAGTIRGGAEPFAAPVGKVLGEQLAGLKALFAK
jgi:uncharacterized protein YndB with AHSA1/START domain